ncbi:hypothetical protein FRC06_001579 [Ceratobasidium sp. 370]|nr:hypothetical protein FRC06_001579 [Ceratobasidium sp. 370]
MVQILALVPGKDIQKCRRVCQHLHEVIDSTAQLQYLIELDYLGYAEPLHPRLDLTYDQKAKLLREHRVRGAFPSHTFTLETTSSSEYEGAKNYTSLCGGVYIEGFGTLETNLARYLELHRLPSWNRGTELKQWKLDLGMDALHVDLDLDLNLLCLVEARDVELDGGPNSVDLNVYLRTLDSNNAHPGAALSKLSWRFDGRANLDDPHAWSISSHIVGNLMGILFSHRRSFTNCLIVWDWPSGSELLHLRNRGVAPGSFTIITQELVVNHRTTTDDLALGYLDMYRLGEPDGSRTVEHTYPIATLSLPLLDSLTPRSSTRFHAAPSSTISSDYLSNSWYRPNPKLYETRADADHFAVKECEANGLPDMTMIPWELWGNRTSWIYQANPMLHAPSAALISGLRSIAGTQSDGPTVIWDCDPRAVRSSARSAASEHGVTPRVCFPKGMGPESWDLSDSLSPPFVRSDIFFGDGSLANQPFCASRLPGRGDSGPTMMQGEHVINIIEPNKIVVSCF